MDMRKYRRSYNFISKGKCNISLFGIVGGVIILFAILNTSVKVSSKFIKSEIPQLRYSEDKTYTACLQTKTGTFCLRRCIPCGPTFSVCPHRRVKNRRLVPLLTPSYPALPKTGGILEFPCSLSWAVFQAANVNSDSPLPIPKFDSFKEWHRRPLNIRVLDGEKRRINVVLTGLGKDLTGGPLSIIRFLNAVLSSRKIGARIINIDGTGLRGNELKRILPKYANTELFVKEADLIYDGMSPKAPQIIVSPDDIFMSTLYFTSLICHETTKHPRLTQKNILYFIQDFEPIFFPQGSDYIEALETYRLPHFALYSTPFLKNYFASRKLGQYKYLPEGEQVETMSYASEPAIKSTGLFNIKALENPLRKKKVIVYARSHADRNAYDLTISVLSKAVCSNLFGENWEIIGTGALHGYTETLGIPCGRNMSMRIYENVPEPEYRKMVQTGDVGLSLMISPHPSLPPFDFAAAGLVTVTNSFDTKTKEMFADISENFVVREPFLDDLIDGLKEAVLLSTDYKRRERGSSINWESDWNGEKCYGAPLMKKVDTWLQTTHPLWNY